jgi:proteasome lid subunit RPN8/RPN11
MAGDGTDGAWLNWSEPQCPFTIEYSARTLDDIRLAVMDAFFSLPRGGAEIGGILLGTFDGNRLSIHEHAALDCEHAFGPSFTISRNDEARLRELLANAPAEHAGLQVVGWYHSHTRSGIFFSDADLEIHKRFFPEPWQVAVVMKPHTFETARIGFFFHERDGRMRTEAAYEELVLPAQPMGQVVRGVPSAPVAQQTNGSQSGGVEVQVTAQPVEDRRPAVTLPPDPAPTVPQFLMEEPAPRRRWWTTAVVGGVITIGAIVGVLKTREVWMSRLMSAIRTEQPATPPAPSMGLRTADFDGQLQIAWDRSSPAVRQGAAGLLEISDGGPLPQSIPLDPAHLQTGTFTYARQSEKVDVKLIVRRTDGQELREATTFLGKLPERKAPVEDDTARRQRDELAERTRKLEKDLQTMREEMRQQQRRRMVNQVSGGKK